MAQNRKCVYSKCMLPNDNKRYKVQFVVLFVAFIVLTSKPAQFTSTSALMFVVPELIDLIYNNVTKKQSKIVRRCFIYYNVVVVVVLVCGYLGIMDDKEDYFYFNTMYLTFSISKKTLGLLIGVDLVIPLMYAISSPNQSQADQMRLKPSKQ